MMFRKLAIVLMTASATLAAQAQTPANHAYAVTSKILGGYDWTEVKQIDLTNGEITRNVFDNTFTSYNVFDGRSARPVPPVKQTDSTRENPHHPFAGLTAACAYDAKSNRLYYVPMFINQLRYLDLNANVPSVFIFQNETFSKAPNTEEAFQMTRMVIAADGNGYAMSNNGMHLVKFTTTGNHVITDLGAVHDAPQNGEISIHDANTSWGGDMLADAGGNLYVITAHNHVFKINIQTKTATYLTRIKGLPESYTTNGAVVDNDGNIMLSSANFLTSYYKVNPEKWEATGLQTELKVYNTSDLANQNLLFETKLEKNEPLVVREKIAVYPNPVTADMFRVSFSNREAGKYNVQLIDVKGRMISDKTVSVYAGAQVSEVRLDPSLSKGMYMVKVLNNNNKEVYLKKIFID